MTSVDSILIFCVDVHMRQPEADPLSVDVISGWPLIGNFQPGMRPMTKIKVIRNFGG